MFKFLSIAFLTGLFFLAGSPNVFAAPSNANNPNLQGVFTGTFGIVGVPGLFVGTDTIMKAGESGTVQQWFYGHPINDPNVTLGYHSVWRVLRNGSCPDNWHTVTSPYPTYGQWFEPNTTYCVHTNAYHVQN